MKNIILVCLLAMLGVQAYAQKAPIRFGKPSMEDLKKTVYDIDTSAAAVILCSYGYFKSDNFQFFQTMRVKILKKEGLHWANWTFNSLSKASIRGKTFNIVDGKKVVNKLTSKSIFNEKIVNDYYVTKVTMPNVKVGSVVDIEINYTGIPFVWYFQQTIPMLYSELVMEPSQYITFKKNYFGYIPFSVASSGRWVTVNVPAFQSEPYMASKENYLAHFEFDITEISIPGKLVKEYSNTWQNVNEVLDKDILFNGALHSNAHFFKLMADTINATAKTDVEKVKAAIDRVHRIRWNGKKKLFVASGLSLRACFKEGEGSSSEINLALISLLRKIGFKTYPVVLRTRDKGHLSEFNPTLRNLNYVLAYAKIGNRFYLIDGTAKFMPFPLLPIRCLNEKGRIVSPVVSRWVNLSNNVKSITSKLYNLKLNKDQSLSGTSACSYKDYAAYFFRNNYRNIGSHDDYIYSLMTKNRDLRIEQDTILNLKDIYQPVIENSTLVLKNQSFSTDSLIYLSVIPDKMKENPFKQEKREYPVDFIYPFEKSVTILITLPENYRVVKLPKSERLVLPGNAGSFLYRIAAAGNHLTIIYRFKINKTVFFQSEYALLKSLYMQAISKEAEPVILKAS